MKKFFSGLLLVAFCLSFAASAANVQEEALVPEEAPALSAQLTDYINRVFSNQENVFVKDANGKDITKAFFAAQEANYESGNLNLIVDALGAGNLVVIERAVPATDRSVTRLIINYTATGFHTRNYKNAAGQQISNKLTLYAQGNYSVYDSTNQISSASAPTVNQGSSYLTPSAGFLCLTSAQPTPSATINTAKTMVTFKLPYYSELYSTQIPYVPLGTLTDTLTFYAYV